MMGVATSEVSRYVAPVVYFSDFCQHKALLAQAIQPMFVSTV